MKNKFSKLIVFIIFLLFIINVKANTINKIDMDVYIDSNGNANITETWYAYLTLGTEGYRTYSKLDGSEMSNLSITDESGRKYEILDTWNSNNSFSDKAYKAALVNKGNDSELCFGISSYGEKVYIIKYDVSNIVRSYSDVQGIYYSFLQMDMPVETAKITIRSDTPFSLDNSRIWGLGYTGESNFNDGNIVLTTKKGLNTGSRMVALVRFNKRIFDTSLTISKSFDDIYDEAFENVQSSSNSKSSLVLILIAIIGAIVLIPLLLFYLIEKLLKKFKRKDYSKGNHSKYLDFGKNSKKLSKEVPYWREIPCYGNINYAYWLCDEFYIVKEDNLIKGIIGAYLLKWFKEETIKINKEKNHYLIDVKNELTTDDSVESTIYYMIKNAAGKNKILEPKEFKKWAKKNHRAIYSISETVNSYILNYLVVKGDMVKKSSAFDLEIKESIKEEAIRTKGFIKFLNDFSLIKEKEHINVKLWDKYLIFAELFGIADKVREEFKKLYPDMQDVNSKMFFDELDMFESVISDLSSACMSGASSGYSGSIISSAFEGLGSIFGSGNSHDYSGSSSSSGGGGSSFSSGGSSSGGSSGGGFR